MWWSYNSSKHTVYNHHSPANPVSLRCARFGGLAKVSVISPEALQNMKPYITPIYYSSFHFILQYPNIIPIEYHGKLPEARSPSWAGKVPTILSDPEPHYSTLGLCRG